METFKFIVILEPTSFDVVLIHLIHFAISMLPLERIRVTNALCVFGLKFKFRGTTTTRQSIFAVIAP